MIRYKIIEWNDGECGIIDQETEVIIIRDLTEAQAKKIVESLKEVKNET